MLDICDKVLVFWDGVSKGTKHTINYANKMGKPIEVSYHYVTELKGAPTGSLALINYIL